MKALLVLAAVALLALPCAAGWKDLAFSSQDNMADERQGRNISLSLTIENAAHTDGYAVYVMNVTLHPPQCVNGGNSVTSGGAIICPVDDPACKIRFTTAGTSAVFNFTGLPTDPDCPSGLQQYFFELNGSSEIFGSESRWAPEANSTTTSVYTIRFTGPDTCGDSVCGPGIEDCLSCPGDCGRCRECNGTTARACRNGSIYRCSNGYYADLVEACAAGCSDSGGVPYCTRLCQEGASRCADGSTMQSCRNNSWANESCALGCVDGACDTDLCRNVECPDTCAAGIESHYGSCDPVAGECVYFGVRNCSLGCEGTSCAVPEAQPTATKTPVPVSSQACMPGIGLVLALAFAGLSVKRHAR
jgi:hypothetical protein